MVPAGLGSALCIATVNLMAIAKFFPGTGNRAILQVNKRSNDTRHLPWEGVPPATAVENYKNLCFVLRLRRKLGVPASDAALLDMFEQFRQVADIVVNGCQATREHRLVRAFWYKEWFGEKVCKGRWIMESMYNSYSGGNMYARIKEAHADAPGLVEVEYNRWNRLSKVWARDDKDAEYFWLCSDQQEWLESWVLEDVEYLESVMFPLALDAQDGRWQGVQLDLAALRRSPAKLSRETADCCRKLVHQLFNKGILDLPVDSGDALPTAACSLHRDAVQLLQKLGIAEECLAGGCMRAGRWRLSGWAMQYSYFEGRNVYVSPVARHAHP